MVYLVSITTFAAVMLLVTYLLSPRPDVVRRRILAGSEEEGEQQRTATPSRRLSGPAVRAIGSKLGRLLPQNVVRHVDTLLIHAGSRMSLTTFLTIWFLSAGAASLLALWLIISLDWGGQQTAVVASIIVFYGAIIPYVMLKRQANKRKKLVERALPDAFDLLLTCVEAGLAVDAAMALVAQRTNGPLALVLTEYLKEVGLGQSRREALEDIAERSGVPGLRRLAAIVAQAGAVGTSMGDVLRIQAAELRATRRLKAQEAAAKAPIKMTIPLALCFMPAMGAVIIMPALINLLDHVGNLGAQ